MTEFEDSPWDGGASNWPDANSYCRDCLIDMNEGEKTKDKCKLPYRKNGSSKVNKGALRALVGGRGITRVEGVPKEKLVNAANRIISWYRQAFGQPAPESVYNIAGKNRPMTKAIIHKAKNGSYKFLGIYSNNYLDKDEAVLSFEAHKEFAAWVKANNVKLPITVLHQPKYPEVFHIGVYMALKGGMITPEQYSQIYQKVYAPYAVGVTEHIIPYKGFVIVIGNIFKNKYDKIELIHKSSKAWGMSHGFLPLRRNAEDKNIIEQYRSFELSILPNSFAANELTVAGIKEN